MLLPTKWASTPNSHPVVVHVHFEKDGRSHGVDVWDSVEAYQLFVQSALVPAMGKVAAARGLHHIAR